MRWRPSSTQLSLPRPARPKRRERHADQFPTTALPQARPKASMLSPTRTRDVVATSLAGHLFMVKAVPPLPATALTVVTVLLTVSAVPVLPAEARSGAHPNES